MLADLPIPVIAGPTAGGKSDLAVELALALREHRGQSAEIITADAFQIYRGMDIGTAKPTLADRRGIPHHLIDLIGRPALRAGSLSAPTPPTPNPPPFTVNDWLTLATTTIADLRARNTLPIVVGGTHLYLKALLDGLFDGPEPDPALRAEITALAPALRRAELERVDPAAALRIHPNDTRRTIRALEVFRLTGRPISEHQTQWDRPTPDPAPSPFLLVILDWDPDALNLRINARVRAMFAAGLLDEVRALLASGPLAPQPAEALGYKQLLPLLEPGRPFPPPPADLDAAAERIKIDTRRFAKNQRTWLRRLRTTPGCLCLTCPPPPGPEAVEAILAKMFP